jgi:amidohydrolase
MGINKIIEDKELEELGKKVVQWRRHLHSHPELSFKEVETAKFIRARLEEILKGVEGATISSLTENSVIVELEGTATHKASKTLAFRADIDALAITENTGLSFASENPGVMHACGHDGHTAILLGTIETISKRLEFFSGKIRFIFQPAEEVPPGGAQPLVDAGVLDGIDEIYGLHIFPLVPVGLIGCRDGSFSANSDIFELTIKGRGSHASMPDQSIDPITIGSSIVSSVNNMVARQVNPQTTATISFGKFTSGNTANAIPDLAHIMGNTRSITPKDRKQLQTIVETAVKTCCEQGGATPDLSYNLGYSSVTNAPDCMDVVRKAAVEATGTEKSVLPIPQSLGGEDFSAYTDKIPGGFFVLAGGSVEDGYTNVNHSAEFDFDERCLPLGVKMWNQIIMDRLGA